MKRFEQDHLLKEIVTGDELADFRGASLELGLVSFQRQRRCRRAVRLCTLAVLPMLLVLGLWYRRSRETPIRQVVSSNPSATAVIPSAFKTPEVKFITDEELFALFPDRPLALIGKPGRQQLVFLDKPATVAGGPL